MLRDSVLSNVYDALAKSAFTAADFAVEISDGEKAPLVSVTFRHDAKFKFQLVQEVSEGKYEYGAVVAPGEYRKQEYLRVRSLTLIPEMIKTWTRNVRDELRVTMPLYSELDELRQALEQHVAAHVSSPEERFTTSEVEELQAKLDKLSERFTEMQERSEITAQELNRLNSELAAIKTNLESFPKAAWYKTAGLKLFATVNTIITSKESRQLLAQQARKALGLDPP